MFRSVGVTLENMFEGLDMKKMKVTDHELRMLYKACYSILVGMKMEKEFLEFISLPKKWSEKGFCNIQRTDDLVRFMHRALHLDD
jgi:hypothetical protein